MKLVLAALALVLALAAVPAHAGGTPAQKCDAAKLKASGKKAACRTGEMAKAATGGTADLAKCTTKFSSAFTTAEMKGGCATTGDAPAIEGRIDAATNGIQAALSATRLVDNGDGTVTDNTTGLQWEKKVAGSGCPHCVSDTYQWSSSGTAPDGGAFTSFPAALNNCVDDGSGPPPTGLTGGFAGHCDWRLPTILELQTIIDPTQGGCGGGSGACIDPIFGPTEASGYWSSTTSAANPIGAWEVFFDSGNVSAQFKISGGFVRAVRGGS